MHSKCLVADCGSCKVLLVVQLAELQEANLLLARGINSVVGALAARVARHS